MDLMIRDAYGACNACAYPRVGYRLNSVMALEEIANRFLVGHEALVGGILGVGSEGDGRPVPVMARRAEAEAARDLREGRGGGDGEDANEGER